jgi:hypothetical protein
MGILLQNMLQKKDENKCENAVCINSRSVLSFNIELGLHAGSK